MEISAGDLAYIIVTLIAVGTAYGILKGRQTELERRISTLEKMVEKQIDVDTGIKEAINGLSVQLASWQSTISEQIKSLTERVSRNEGS